MGTVMLYYVSAHMRGHCNEAAIHQGYKADDYLRDIRDRLRSPKTAKSYACFDPPQVDKWLRQSVGHTVGPQEASRSIQQLLEIGSMLPWRYSSCHGIESA